MGLALIGLGVGGLAGFLLGRFWAAVVVILLPAPWLIGIALGLWGDGLGESWGYVIPIWIGPACLGFVIGVLVRSAMPMRNRGKA